MPPALAPRDNFTAATKRRIAARAGYRCSNPSCRAETIGPSDAAVSGVSTTGDAAHITAAAVGGPRYDSTLSTAERKAPDNGIWLCKFHASIVDSDHYRYSVELLRAWRNRAEEMARLRREPDEDARWDFLKFARLHSVGPDAADAKRDLAAFAADFVGDVGAHDVLASDDVSIVENVLFELLLNAIEHEQAQEVTLTSSPLHISATYTSQSHYGLEELLENDQPQGGVDAVNMLETETQGRIQLNYQVSGDRSVWIVTRVRLGYSDDPCAINLRDTTADEQEIFVAACEGCETVHVHGHLHDHSSDNWVTARYVKELIDEGRRVVVHCKPGPLARHLQRTILEVIGDTQTFALSEHA